MSQARDPLAAERRSDLRDARQGPLEARAGAGPRFPYRYAVYGITLHSEIELTLPAAEATGEVEVWLSTASSDFFASALQGAELEQRDRSWYQFARTRDGSAYVRWEGVGEFLVPSDGRRLVCREAQTARAESFHVYLLGQALSFALVCQGLEPLHATAVEIDGRAVAFLGECGTGKSTLAARFLAAGHALLTDDVLVLRPSSTHQVLAWPGPGRIKLFPEVATELGWDPSAATTMNAETEKLIVPLAPALSRTTPLPLGAIYSLARAPQGQDLATDSIEPMVGGRAALELLKHTFNYQVRDGERLKRQLEVASAVLARVPLRALRYRSGLEHLRHVVDAVRTDLQDAAAGRSSHDGELR